MVPRRASGTCLGNFAFMSPQTYIGSIIASVNPYKPIKGLYEPSTVERYSRAHLGELPPHVFAVANECYRCLWKCQDNQCVLIRYLWVGYMVGARDGPHLSTSWLCQVMLITAFE